LDNAERPGRCDVRTPFPDPSTALRHKQIAVSLQSVTVGANQTKRRHAPQTVSADNALFNTVKQARSKDLSAFISEQRRCLNKLSIIGWIAELTGTALWIYADFVTGHKSVVEWHAFAPWWIADFLPNIESEIGMVLVFAGMVPLYWPARQADSTTSPST